MTEFTAHRCSVLPRRSAVTRVFPSIRAPTAHYSGSFDRLRMTLVKRSAAP
jgi:hypothetical protein